MKSPSTLVLCLTAAAFVGCASVGSSPASASAALAPTQGNAASGTVRFESTGSDVQVQVRIAGLKPNAEHGFHIHERGDCSAPDATSAGGHFNPHGAPHGPQEGPHHAGDMPSLKSNASGVAETHFTLKGVSIGTGTGADDMVGKAVVVHAQPDDYKTQPTGNSGPRIACGVIRR